jgi:hypothetical protein
MTGRELKISQAILDELHDADGGQFIESQLHANATVRIGGEIALNEFNEAFAALNALGCFIGVHRQFKPALWSLSAKGEQIRQEVRA